MILVGSGNGQLEMNQISHEKVIYVLIRYELFLRTEMKFIIFK